MAVQWRTETSTGNLTQCYERYVQSAVEEQRLELGFGREQVYFNTDLVGQASTTYNASVRVVPCIFPPVFVAVGCLAETAQLVRGQRGYATL